MPLLKPSFLQARDLLSATIQGGTMGSGGITWSTAIEMSVAGAGTATWKAFEIQNNPNNVLFMPSDMGVANYQNEHEDFNFTVREITPQNGLGTLTAIAAAYDYARVVYNYRGRHLSTGASAKCVAVGARGGLRNGIAAGENVQELSLQPIGYGVWFGLSTDTAPI
ncbi:hypothetical protein [Armatimonas sp.]|uniref:hypothetical protein n=1 Tax=Armatimonas sp. TaxID=1872638 RepID=UPI0037520A48